MNDLPISLEREGHNIAHQWNFSSKTIATYTTLKKYILQYFFYFVYIHCLSYKKKCAGNKRGRRDEL